MRLTLRTMLAYLDDILEPSDREDISQKIADSQFAGRLLERIRDCNRNPRLPAPKLMGSGLGMDPNTVAEYLDNTLAGERVPEFETVCLPPADAGPEMIESDVYLAEVAACHQILTMVLGRPAQIDPAMKRRMYGIINHSQPATTEVGAADGELRLAPVDGLAKGSLADFEIKTHRQKREIPEYLRQPAARSKWKPILAAAILIALLVGSITMALGRLDHNHPLLGWMFSDGGADQKQVANNGDSKEHNNLAAAPTGETPAPTTTAEASAQTTADQPANSSTADAQNPGVPTGQTPATENRTETSTPPAGNFTATGNVPAGNVPTGNVATDHPNPADRPAPTTETQTMPPANPAASATGAAAVNPAGPTTMPVDTTHPTTPPEVPLPPDTVPPSTLPGNVTAGNAAAPTVPPQPAPTVDDKPLGRFLPAKDIVLLRYDNLTKQWLRLPSATGAALMGGDQLLVLPNYRPTLALMAGITVQIPPETQLELEPVDANGVPGIKIIYGRIVAMTTGRAGAELRLDLGIASGKVTFVDADAILALEVRRNLPAGANPEVVDPVTNVDLYAADGQLQWTSTDGAIATLKAPQRWTLPSNPPDTGAAGAQAQVVLPKWIRPESLSPNDARCAELLATDLENNKPLLIALREMAARPQVEQHAFAAQCLALLNEFDPLVSALGDPDRKQKWPADLATLKAALTRGPVSAAAVREAFEKQHSDGQGKDLYRMLLGYTKDQLQAGEAARLIEALDSDNLDSRVLAFASIQEITNKTHLYRPEVATPTGRAQPMKLWREDLRTGAIVPREPPPQK